MFFRPIAVLVVGLALAAPVVAEGEVMDFAKDDAEMNAAIETARATLPQFWSRLAAPAANEADFSLKLGISDAVGTEHFWCGEIEGDATGASCVIANTPVNVHVVAQGERVEVDPAIISDWMYYRDDKIVGGETIRVMIPHLDKKEAARMREMMAD